MAAPVRYCPGCFATNEWEAEFCTACGTKLAAGDTYAERLAWVLDHPDTATAMLAADLLARRGDRSAVDRLLQATESDDPYRAAAAAHALMAFDDERAEGGSDAAHSPLGPRASRGRGGPGVRTVA